MSIAWVVGLFYFFPVLAWCNFASQINADSIDTKVDNTALWPINPICGFVAATNIAAIDPQWSCNASGSAESDPCNWNGIICDSNSNITKLSVHGDGSLNGTLTPLLGDISTLAYVAIQYGKLSGTLPSSWGSLTAMTTLDLFQNSLTGTLPSSWSALEELTALYLHQNSLSGTLPSLWSSLRSISAMYLHQNWFTGPLPSSWSSLTAIHTIDLTHNSLTGTLPSSWGSITSIVALYLYQNSLTGTLPSSWGGAISMTALFLYQNCLSGSLPSSWGSLRAMKSLSLSQISVTGTLPSSWSALTALEYLSLFQNSLTGTLPSSWGAFTALNSLYLYQNNFSSTLPASWGSLTAMDTMYLFQNSFTGSLPSSWNSLILLEFLHLYQNSLSGSLPSSWGSLTAINSLVLYENSLTSTLPSSWSSLTAIIYLDVSLNALTGSLPPSWSNMQSLEYLFVNDNSLSNSLPASWSLLASIADLSLSGNSLTGLVSPCFDGMLQLQYLYLNRNSFSGSIPVSWGSNIIRTVDVSSNEFSGRLSPNETSFPVSLNYLNAAYNSLSGTIPPAVALFGNISYLNISRNDGIVGSIPSEFCSSVGVSIDVGGTGIDCYSGCLTSSFVLVSGASPECHNGNIMKQFVIITVVCVAIIFACTALYHWYDWWSPILASVAGKTMSCEFLNIPSRIFTWLRYLVFGAEGAERFDGDGGDGSGNVRRSVGAAAAMTSLSFTVFAMAVAKLLLGLVVSLTLNNWWTYSGGHDLARNNEVLTSCSNPTVGNCFSFCGDVEVITVDITTDDVVFDDDYLLVPTAHSIAHTQSDSYCTASLPGYCGYQVWIDLKLPPILLQLLGLLLQIILWRFGSDGFPATPQKAQYDLILKQFYPQISVLCNQCDKVIAPDVSFVSRITLLRQLASPIFLSIFWFLELVTVIYVWGELIFPPVYCGSVPPLSLYYYPILMSLLDLMKLNIYTCVELWEADRHVESVLILLDLQLFFTHLWVTVAMGLIFVAGVFRDCCLTLLLTSEVVMGRPQQKLEWPVERKSDAVEMATTLATSTASATSNPMLSIDSNDVELAGGVATK